MLTGHCGGLPGGGGNGPPPPAIRLGAGRNKDIMISHLPFASEAVLQALGCSVASVVQAAGPPGFQRLDKGWEIKVVKV